jgi:hypothetical protein
MRTKIHRKQEPVIKLSLGKTTISAYTQYLTKTKTVRISDTLLHILYEYLILLSMCGIHSVSAVGAFRLYMIGWPSLCKLLATAHQGRPLGRNDSFPEREKHCRFHGPRESSCTYHTTPHHTTPHHTTPHHTTHETGTLSHVIRKLAVASKSGERTVLVLKATRLRTSSR